MTAEIRRADYAEVRAALLDRHEIALLDVREEDPHAQSHPLFAANFPLGRLELNAWATLPRRDVPIVTLDEGDERAAEAAARKLRELGYRDVAVFRGGVAGWAAAGGELFRDVNVPSKAFGELVEARRHTPSFSAEEVQALLAARDRMKRLEGGLLADAERVAKAAELAYGKGAMSLMDLLDARRTLRQIQIEAASARADYAKALSDWQVQAEYRKPQ